MAKLHITEFSTIHAWGQYGYPDATQLAIDIGVETDSAAFQFANIRFVPRADCHIAFGANNPQATLASEFFGAGQEYSRLVTIGDKLSVIAAV